jgi:hypothetical protein
MFTGFRDLTPLQHHPLALLLKTLSERSASPLALRGTQVVLPLAQATLFRARDGGRSHPHTTHQTHWWRD